MVSLNNKGKKKFKYYLLNINLCVLTILAGYFILKIMQTKNKLNKEHLLIGLIVSVIAIVFNYLSIKNYKFDKVN